MKTNARTVVLVLTVLSWVGILAGCSDSTGPFYTELYTLSSAPEPIEGGRLRLEYSRTDGGRAWYGLTHPHVTQFGSFQRRGTADLDLWLRSGARLTGDFYDRGQRLELNDGTRWQRVR